MIADHVTLPAILCFIFGRQDALKKVAISQKKLPYCFQFFGNLLVPELIIKGWEGLILANFEELFIGTVKMTQTLELCF